MELIATTELFNRTNDPSWEAQERRAKEKFRKIQYQLLVESKKLEEFK